MFISGGENSRALPGALRSLLGEPRDSAGPREAWVTLGRSCASRRCPSRVQTRRGSAPVSPRRPAGIVRGVEALLDLVRSRKTRICNPAGKLLEFL